MARRTAVILALLLVLAGGLGLGVMLGLRLVDPGPLPAARVVVVSRGGGLETVAHELAAAGVIDTPWLFMAAARLPPGRALQAGEFAFPAHVSLLGAIDILRNGKPVVHKLSVPEGLTSAQVVALITNEPALSGDISRVPAEGSLLPETYHFLLGDSRAALLERMQAAMTALLAEQWGQRAVSPLLTTPQQAVILASLVEKETAVAAERPRIAGVFLNRLQQNMKLQSDPTIVYALTNGSGSLGRALTKADIRFDSPYNTYLVEGLPPGPIANPGRASLQAVLHPERHEWLYFVADGSGGHAFARTLADHNRNVARWRDLKQPDSGATPPSAATSP